MQTADKSCSRPLRQKEFDLIFTDYMAPGLYEKIWVQRLLITGERQNNFNINIKSLRPFHWIVKVKGNVLFKNARRALHWNALRD